MHANKIVLLLLILFAALAQNAKINEPRNKIDLLTLQKMLPTGELTLFDVREPQELKAKGEIPGAVNIPFSQVEHAFKLPPNIFHMKYQIVKPETTSSGMVLFCVSGRRATLAQAILKQMGYQKVQVFDGGFQDLIKGGSISMAKSHPKHIDK